MIAQTKAKTRIHGTMKNATNKPIHPVINSATKVKQNITEQIVRTVEPRPAEPSVIISTKAIHTGTRVNAKASDAKPCPHDPVPCAKQHDQLLTSSKNNR
jgi:hypothetical protein